MKIGIPRAGMYYRYGVLWEEFFKALGIEYVLSPETNKSILEHGSAIMADESCLASKVYMGHVSYLLDKCDCLFIPWLSNFGEYGINCTRFRAFPAMTANLFRDRSPQILTYAIDFSGTQDMKHAGDEETAFLSMAEALNKSKKQVREAYRTAKELSERAFADKVTGLCGAACHYQTHHGAWQPQQSRFCMLALQIHSRLLSGGNRGRCRYHRAGGRRSGMPLKVLRLAAEKNPQRSRI